MAIVTGRTRRLPGGGQLTGKPEERVDESRKPGRRGERRERRLADDRDRFRQGGDAQRQIQLRVGADDIEDGHRLARAERPVIVTEFTGRHPEAVPELVELVRPRVGGEEGPLR